MMITIGLLLFLAGVPLALPCDNAKMEIYQCLKNFFNQTEQRLPPQLERMLDSSATSNPQGKGRRSRRQAEDDGQLNGRPPEGNGVTGSSTGGSATPRPVVDKTRPPIFKQDWCGPFSTYVSCMETAERSCTRAGLYTCSIMTVFSAMYGTDICAVDISDWVAKDIRSCKAAAGLRVDVTGWTCALIIALLIVGHAVR